MNYNVTYPGGKMIQMHNSHPARFEKALNKGLKDGVIIGWNKVAETKEDREFRKAFTPNRYGEYA